MMLILNAVLAIAVVTAILALLGWGIATDRARTDSIARHPSRRTRAHGGARASQAAHPRYGRAPELSS